MKTAVVDKRERLQHRFRCLQLLTVVLTAWVGNNARKTNKRYKIEHSPFNLLKEIEQGEGDSM